MAAAKPLVLNVGRQYPLVLTQAFNFENLDGTAATLVAKLPRNAVIVSGFYHVTTAYGTGAKIKIGVTADDDQYGELDVASVGAKALTIPQMITGTTELFAKASASQTAGAGVLTITYVIEGRANEAQP